MKHEILLLAAVALYTTACGMQETTRPVPVFELGGAIDETGWTQWGQNAQHHGRMHVIGQSLNRLIASAVFDPFVEQEKAAEHGELLIHYQSPLTDDTGVFMSFKSGHFVDEHWDAQEWGEKRFALEGGKLVEK